MLRYNRQLSDTGPNFRFEVSLHNNFHFFSDLLFTLSFSVACFGFICNFRNLLESIVSKLAFFLPSANSRNLQQTMMELFRVEFLTVTQCE